MKERLANAWTRLDPRLRMLLLACAVLFALAEGWLLLLRQPLARYQSLHAERMHLEQLMDASADRSAEAKRIEVDIERLQRRIGSDLPGSSTEQLVVAIVARLDRLALRHGVTLVAVRPGERKEVLMFEEVSFDIKAMGKYLPLVAWLTEVQRELGPLVVTRFEVKPGADGPLTMEIAIAAYRAPAEGRP